MGHEAWDIYNPWSANAIDLLISNLSRLSKRRCLHLQRWGKRERHLPTYITKMMDATEQMINDINKYQ